MASHVIKLEIAHSNIETKAEYRTLKQLSNT